MNKVCKPCSGDDSKEHNIRVMLFWHRHPESSHILFLLPVLRICALRAAAFGFFSCHILTPAKGRNARGRQKISEVRGKFLPVYLPLACRARVLKWGQEKKTASTQPSPDPALGTCAIINIIKIIMITNIMNIMNIMPVA